MRILIINQPLNNRGDEAAHKAFVKSLLTMLPEAYIAVLFVNSYSPEGIKQFSVDNDRIVYMNLYPDGEFWEIAEKWISTSVSTEWNHKAFDIMRAFYDAADYVICAPGGICMGGFQDWWHLFYLKFAQYRHKSLIYYGRSFGPFPVETESNRRFKEESLELLRYFSFISIRDKKTEKFAKEMNVSFSSTYDVAFLETPDTTIPQDIKELISNDSYIVLVPNLLLWHSSYKDKFTKKWILEFYSKIIDFITNKYPESKIVMLPQTFGNKTYMGDDILFFRDIEKHKQDERIIVVDDVYSSNIQQSIIANSLLVIGARYHSIVFAINQDVPFIALSYEHKIAGLLSALGKQDCMVDITGLNQADSATEKEILYAIKEKLSTVKRNGNIQDIVKSKTLECMNKLVDFLRQNVTQI